MKFNPQVFFVQFPALKDIATRLHETEQQAKLRNTENEKQASRHNGTISEFGKPKKAQRVYGDHAVISSYYRDKQWWPTPNVPKEGERAFVKSLESIINTRNPDAIHVDIYKGKGGRNREPDFSSAFYLTENAEEIMHHAQAPAPARVELGEVMQEFDKKLESLKIQSGDTGATQMELFKLTLERERDKMVHQFERKEDQLRHENEIREKEREIKDLQNIIRQKTDEISYLEAELDETSGELSGIDNKEKSILDHPVVQQGVSLLSGLVQTWAKIPPSAIAGNTEGTKAPAETAALEDTPADKYSKLDPAHREGIDKLSDFFAIMPILDFRRLFILLVQLQNPDGSLNTEALDDLTSFSTDNKE